MPGWRNWSDATDLKFVDRKIMWVRLPPRAPNALHIVAAKLEYTKPNILRSK